MYTYPTIQSLCQDTVFLLKDVFDNEKYTLFKIPYRHKGIVFDGYVSKKELQNRIDLGMVKVLCKSNFANGQIFIKIPLKYISNDSRIMETTESVSNKLF
jgi:hypothetical protein